MIDFRYHLVSIVAVFLALAIGIVLGSTELQGNTLDLLRSSSDSLKSQLNAVSAERDSAQAQLSANGQFLQNAEQKLLARTLTGDRVVLITEPGAPSSITDGVKQAATMAGATITGEIALQPKFNDLSGANLSSLSAINAEMSAEFGPSLAAGADPATLNQLQAAQLVATAVLARTPTQAAALSLPDAQTLLTAYAQGGYLSLTGAPYNRSTLAVLVAPQSAPADGPNDPANEILLAVAAQFAAASAATLVAGPASGSAASGSAIAVLRSSGVAGQVSSVDNADTTLGQISVVWALAAQLAGGKPASYGISGASAVSPVPQSSPTATVTPTVSDTASAASGRGGKPVKHK